MYTYIHMYIITLLKYLFPSRNLWGEEAYDLYNKVKSLYSAVNGKNCL